MNHTYVCVLSALYMCLGLCNRKTDKHYQECFVTYQHDSCILLLLTGLGNGAVSSYSSSILKE